jgi:hypothetical protein
VNGSDLLSVPVEAERDLRGRPPWLVLTASRPILGFAVHPDNKRFLLLHQTKDTRATPRVVLNWLQTRRTSRSTGVSSR